MKSQISYIDEELSMQSDSDFSTDYSPSYQPANMKKQKIKKPKRNKSAFILFSSDMRPQLKSQTNSNSNEMMVKLAQLWKDLPADQKEEYNQKALQDKDRYNRELAIYSEANPTKEIHNRTKNNHVKKPCSAYALFVKSAKEEIKSENKGLKMADVFKILSQKWKELGQAEKAKFEEQSKVEKKVAKEKQRAIMGPKGAKASEAKGRAPAKKNAREQDEEKYSRKSKAIKKENVAKVIGAPIADLSDFDKTDYTSKTSKSQEGSPALISIFEDQFDTNFLNFATLAPNAFDTDMYFAKDDEALFAPKDIMNIDHFNLDLLDFSLKRESSLNMNLYDDLL